jgi:predicted DNA-binding transcriptional regulator AlpA
MAIPSAAPATPPVRAGTRYLTRDEVCRRWGIARATSYRYERSGYLTPPVQLGPGAARWPLAEIEGVEARAAAKRAGLVRGMRRPASDDGSAP